MTNDPNNGVSGSDQGRYSPHPGVASERQRLKRFYREVGIERRGDGYAVVLDGRTVRTPARRELALPTEALADAVASEWRAQDEFIEPAGMPLTRIVNSGLDGVTGREAAVRADVVKYASSDLLCYAAEGPAELAKRQATAWGPIHRWAAEALGIALKQAAGVMPVEQDAETLAVVAAELERFEALPLAAMHVMTTLTGS
ncbi:MAG: ATP12 family chaperone protein, partial [Hyphomicrobiaceae bacterium]